MILQGLFLGILVGYAAMMLRFLHAWRSIPTLSHQSQAPSVFISVLVPVRNEANHLPALLKDLERQTYGTQNFEVLILDDHSTDHTAQLVEAFKRDSQLSLSILSLAEFPDKKNKKGALEVGIQAAKGTWIVCTDGDCRVPRNWLQSINQLRYESGAKLISGPVVLAPSRGMFEDLQSLEFSALIGVGAASIQMGAPTMCNGANIAYEKEAFTAVHGFAGNQHIASGDDEFLLHKINLTYPSQVRFLKTTEAIVQTVPKPGVQEFLQQRIRWASKWRHYDSKASKFLAVLVLTANLAFFVSMVAAGTQNWSWGYFACLAALKLGPDALLLSAVLGFFKKKRLLSLIGVLQLVYLPYVLFTAMLGLSGKYQWKGRSHHTK